MSRDHTSLTTGASFSTALDPHRRQSLQAAIDQVFDELEDGETPSVALVGWQAATLIDSVYERADRLVIIEEDERYLESIRQGLRAQDRGKKVQLLPESPAEVDLDEPVDIAVASAASTWFIEGEAAEQLEQIRRNIVAEGGRMVPRRYLHLFELASPPNNVGGMPLRTPRFSRPGEPVPTLSESKHFSTTNLIDGSDVRAEVDDTIIVKPLVGGRLTALRLTTLCELADGVMQVTSQTGLQSILVPLREDIDIEAGQPVSIHLSYEPGRGLDQTKFTARALPEHEAGGWAHSDHPVTGQFQENIAQMIEMAEQRGRAADLQKVVQYTVEPHGDVSRLTAFFWTIDEEYRKPVKQIVEQFRGAASSKIGEAPDDETIYELMLEVYRDAFGDDIDSVDV
jgi:hypothetical protein